MQRLDIFKSEGGFRIAGAVYNDSPVMDYSPWFETLAAAEKAKQQMIDKDNMEILISELVANGDIEKLEALTR